jgi:hypothetical protein
MLSFSTGGWARSSTTENIIVPTMTKPRKVNLDITLLLNKTELTEKKNYGAGFPRRSKPGRITRGRSERGRETPDAAAGTKHMRFGTRLVNDCRPPVRIGRPHSRAIR